MTSLEEAIERMKASMSDYFLLDCRVPGMEDLVFTRLQHEHFRVPVILYTHHSGEDVT